MGGDIFFISQKSLTKVEKQKEGNNFISKWNEAVCVCLFCNEMTSSALRNSSAEELGNGKERWLVSLLACSFPPP